MDILIISITAFVVAILTFFSGFGLGTILTPVMMIFLPVELAIALTGVVHFFNNIFKLFLVGRHAVRQVLIRFGIPAVIAAFAGAWVLIHIPDAKPLFTYGMGERNFEVYPVKFTISIILLFFAVFDLIPFLANMQFDKKHLPLGGILSGFFGGLSGNQGALRAAFLIKTGLSKEAFVGTAVVVSAFVDFTRLSVYSTRFLDTVPGQYWSYVLFGTLAAISGAYIGNLLLKKITLRFLHMTVAILLILLSIGLAMGII
jgi:uncharacterized membrane protein YfcA